MPVPQTNKQTKKILLVYLVVYSQTAQLWLYLNISSFISLAEQEHEFLAMQRVEFEKFCKELIDLHRERMYNLEMQFLQDKHSLKRGLYTPLISSEPRLSAETINILIFSEETLLTKGFVEGSSDKTEPLS